MIDSSKQFPATQKYIDAFRQFISRSAAARSKAIADLEEKARNKKWEVAETDLYKVYDRLEMGTVFLTHEEIQAIYTPFVHVESAVRNAMNETRSHKAKEILTLAHKQALPDYASIVAAMDGAIQELGMKDTAAWNGEQINAQQLIVKFGDTWREAQVGALKARAIGWALKSRRHARLSETSSPTVDPQTGDKGAEEYNAFSQQVKGCFARLVDVETSRMKSEEIPSKYIELLRGLATIARETDNAEFAAVLNQSLAKLTAKNTDFEKQVKQYDLVTSDVLRCARANCQCTCSTTRIRVSGRRAAIRRSNDQS